MVRKNMEKQWYLGGLLCLKFFSSSIFFIVFILKEPLKCKLQIYI